MDNETRPVEIRDLNKTQLIFLAILLSFIVSIATGIVTVTLMDQAPPAVTQTIEKVVQQTIEKVTPDNASSGTDSSGAAVAVSDDDLVTAGVGAVRAATARFTLSDSAASAGSDASTTSAGSATTSGSDSGSPAYLVGAGTFLVPAAGLDSSKAYFIQIAGVSYDAAVSAVSPLGFAVAKASVPASVLAAQSMSRLSIGTDASLRAGQTVVVVTAATVRKGIVQETPSTQNGLSIGMDLGSSQIGGLVVALDGSVAGLVVQKPDAKGTIVDADTIAKLVAASMAVSKASASAGTTTAGTAFGASQGAAAAGAFGSAAAVSPSSGQSPAPAGSASTVSTTAPSASPPEPAPNP